MNIIYIMVGQIHVCNWYLKYLILLIFVELISNVIVKVFISFTQHLHLLGKL